MQCCQHSSRNKEQTQTPLYVKGSRRSAELQTCREAIGGVGDHWWGPIFEKLGLSRVLHRWGRCSGLSCCCACSRSVATIVHQYACHLRVSCFQRNCTTTTLAGRILDPQRSAVPGRHYHHRLLANLWSF